MFIEEADCIPGERQSGGQRAVLVLLSASVIVSCLLVVFPESSQNASAVYPKFTFPNVKIDKGPGWVLMHGSGGPDIASDEHGVLHVVWGDNRTGYDEGIYYAHSYDGGATWLDEKRIDYFLGLFNSVPDVEVDTSGGPHSGNIYVVWQLSMGSMAEVYFTRSIDGGFTWTEKHRLDSTPSDIGSMSPTMAVDLDGTIYVAFEDGRWGNSDIFIIWSEDGGLTWSTEVKAPVGSAYDFDPDLVSFGGTEYLIWVEASEIGTKIWLARTSDQGKSWATSIIVSIPSTEGDAISPSLAVSPYGVLHMAWSSRDNRSWSFIVYSQSVDSGITWSSPVYVSDAYPDQNITQNSVSMLVSLDVLYIVWTENRHGDYDIFASWSETDGRTWGDSIFNDNDRRVDDTDANGVTTDDDSDQCSPSAVAGPAGIFVVWADKRDMIANHLYFASFNPSEVLVTEVRDGPDGSEQIEIHNPLKTPADLTGFGLFIDGTRFDLTPLGTVPVGAYRTIGDPPSSDLHVDITLRDEGSSILLLNRWDYYKDSVSYGQMGPAPDPLDSESVWRVPSVGASDSSWTRAPIPSFGGENAGRLPLMDSSIKLNEVYFNAANPNELFVEIRYGGDETLDLSGYTLVGDSTYVLPSAMMSEGRRLFGVRFTQAPSLFGMMSLSGDNLYLYDPTGSLVDMVGWSSPHMQGRSMARVPDGFGTASGYDDTTSIAAGWRFDQIPTPPRVLIGPEQGKAGDPGESVLYTLFVTNEDYMGAYVNIERTCGSQGWTMTLLKADGVTPLADSPGDADAIPDVGYLQPGASATIQVRIDIPPLPASSVPENSTVKATSSSDPQATDTTHLTTTLNPYLMPEAYVSPASIWVESAPSSYQPKEASVQVSVAGRGSAIVSFNPQDTVLLIDSSGSMEKNDPLDLRLYAAKLYVDMLSEPDRAAVVDFDTDAVLLNNEHLSSDYERIKSNIDLIDSYGWTNISYAIRVATDELMQYGNSSHTYTEILLTDGADTMGNSPTKIMNEANRAARAGIVIYTIGLLNGGEVDEQILEDIAAATGGRYFAAWRPEDLEWIYRNIGNEVRSLAGYDRDITDAIPMVNVFLPSHINYVPGSVAPLPGYIRVTAAGTNIQWNVSRINIGERWWGYFKIKSEVSGPSVPVMSYPETRLTYTRYDDRDSIVPFPMTTVEVKAPPPPPTVHYTITRNPEIGTVRVDGVDYPAPWTFTWVVGGRHSIAAPDIEEVGQRERYVFSAWDDSGAIVHDITVGNVDRTITAIYARQFRPDVGLTGLDPAHSVSAHFTSRKKAVVDSGLYDRWSNWADEATSVYFGLVGTNGSAVERRITLEDFGRPPWSKLDSAFDKDVYYWHQVMPSVLLQGLPESHPVEVSITKFGSQLADACWVKWSDWLDHGTVLSVGGRIDVSSVERYVNTISPNLDILEWIVTSPEEYVVQFVHQFMPSIRFQGLSEGNGVAAHFVSMQHDATQSGLHQAWSDWVDAGARLFFDAASSRSTSEERWVTREDFLSPPWDAVDSPFSREIVYWHQNKVTVKPEGLPSHVGLPIRFVQFGVEIRVRSTGEWSDWIDHSAVLEVAGRFEVGQDERFINEISMEQDVLEWTITSPATYNVPFLHQFRPTVQLQGTDDQHTVNVTYRDSTESQDLRMVTGLSGQWSDWVDCGGELAFPGKTTGDPPRETTDQTVFVVDSAFAALIRYGSAGSPPAATEANLKPLISAIFVILLVVLGALCGYRRPLDRFMPQVGRGMSSGAVEEKAAMLRQLPIEKKLEVLSIDEMKDKFARDRRSTIALLVAPMAVVEGLTGILSLLTGALRVPDGGAWLCVGLVANSLILLGGILFDLLLQHHGYRVPGEKEISLMKSKDNRPMRSSPAPPRQSRPAMETRLPSRRNE